METLDTAMDTSLPTSKDTSLPTSLPDLSQEDYSNILVFLNPNLDLSDSQLTDILFDLNHDFYWGWRKLGLVQKSTLNTVSNLVAHRISKNGKSTVQSFSLDPLTKAYLDVVSSVTGLNRSELLRELIAYTKANGYLQTLVVNHRCELRKSTRH